MGWTSSQSWTTKEDALNAYLRDATLVSTDPTMPSRKVLDHSLRGNEAYVLEEVKAPGDEKPFRYITVVLLSKAGGDWGFKDMPEWMGPYYYNCPKKLLKRAPLSDMSPAMAEQCEDWRDRVEHARKAKKNQIKPEVGKTYLLRNTETKLTILYKLPRGWACKDEKGQVWRVYPRQLENIQ